MDSHFSKYKVVFQFSPSNEIRDTKHRPIFQSGGKEHVLVTKECDTVTFLDEQGNEAVVLKLEKEHGTIEILYYYGEAVYTMSDMTRSLETLLNWGDYARLTL